MVHESLEQKEEFNNSKFYMWRCVTAMAHADGLIHEDEVAYLDKIFARMLERGEVTPEAYSTLKEDLQKPQNISALLAHIDNPKYRGQVIYFARLLAFADGENSPSEEQLLKRMHIDVTSGLDMEAIQKDVQYEVQKELVLHEIENDSDRPTKGLSGLIDRLALKFDIDLMD